MALKAFSPTRLSARQPGKADRRRGQKAGEQTVIFRKAITAGHGAHPHRRLIALRECDDLIPGTITRDRCSDNHRRMLRLA